MSCQSSIFEPEFVAGLCEMFERRISFNQLIGLKIDSLEADGVAGHVPMRDELLGHYAHGRLHGGVISATLDAMGGLAVMAAIGARHLQEAAEARLARFAKLGTIDLRVDYLRQAIGTRFIAKATVMRLGSRVASTRMEFLDSEGRLLSTGAAAYIMS